MAKPLIIVIAFLLNTLTTALGQRWKAVSKKQPGLADPFGRILTEDSTQHRFHMGNAKTFKAHDNGKSETAGVKVDFTIDLLTGQAVDETIHCATAQDKCHSGLPLCMPRAVQQANKLQFKKICSFDRRDSLECWAERE